MAATEKAGQSDDDLDFLDLPWQEPMDLELMTASGEALARSVLESLMALYLPWRCPYVLLRRQQHALDKRAEHRHSISDALSMWMLVKS